MFKFKMLFVTLILVTFACTGDSQDPKSLKEVQKKQKELESRITELEKKLLVAYDKLGLLPKEIPIADSYYQGASKPYLTIVEFSDFQCPYCAKVSPTLDSLVKTYPNEIRVVFKHFPLSFHKQAKSAHAAALAAGKQGKFFEYRYIIAQKFRDLTKETYIAVAKDIGLNLEQFEKEMSLTPEVEGIIAKDVRLGAQVGVRGTPTLFANGFLVADRSFNGFVKLLNEAKKKKS